MEISGRAIPIHGDETGVMIPTARSVWLTLYALVILNISISSTLPTLLRGDINRDRGGG